MAYNEKMMRTIVVILLVSLLPLLSLVRPGVPYVHDGQDHVTRIANFYQALTEGIIVPRWGANLNWGYGHPVLMFLYPFPSYVASLVHMLGFSFVDSTKLVFALAYLASGVTMFLWMNAAWGLTAGFVGSLLYQFAPYRFVDLHVRGALGEHVAFIFPPLVLYCILKKKWIGFSLSLAALILSHNAVSLMFLPIIVLWALYQKKLFTFQFILYTFLSFALSAFFWVPAVLEGKFTLRDIVTAGQIKEFVPWVKFFYSPWSYGDGNTLTKSLGFAQWIGIAASIWFFVKTKNRIIGTLLVLLICSLFIMTPTSAFIWRKFTFLEKFQFPWRFLSLSVFLAATLGGISISKKKILIPFAIFALVATAPMWRPKDFKIRHESFYTGVYPGTTDTGESSPIWSVRFMERTPANHLEVVDGEATVKEVKRTTTTHEYEIIASKPTLMLENTLYFPGWNIYLDGVATDIQFQNPSYRGLMTFRVTEETKHVRVVFEDTKVRKAANMVSAASFILLGLVSVGGFVWQKRK